MCVCVCMCVCMCVCVCVCVHIFVSVCACDIYSTVHTIVKDLECTFKVLKLAHLAVCTLKTDEANLPAFSLPPGTRLNANVFIV